MQPAAASDAPPILIPMPRLSQFVRQLSHDVRNGLNAIDLQATLVSELATDPETATEARKLRAMVSNVTQSLQQLGGYFGAMQPNTIPFPARELAEALVERIAKAYPAEMEKVACTYELGSEPVVSDFELISTALGEIFKNAFQFRESDARMEFRAYQADGSMVFELREPKTAVAPEPESWGREPLVSTRRGGLGLGLFHVRRIAAAHRGALEQTFDNQRLTTRLVLPLH